MPSFRGEAKLILRHVKNTCKYKQIYLARHNSPFRSPVPPASYQMILLVEFPQNELWWTNQSFPLSTSFHHDSPCLYYLGDKQ
jgi:hypothetical protein